MADEKQALDKLVDAYRQTLARKGAGSTGSGKGTPSTPQRPSAG